MKDKIVIIAAIVAIHFVILLLFVFTGDNDTDTTNQDPAPVEQQVDTDTQNNKATTTPDTGDHLSEDLFSPSIQTDQGLSKATDEQIYKVVSGDNLSKISKKFYGTDRFYKYIYEANKDKMKSPQAVRVGQKLIIPPRPE